MADKKRKKRKIDTYVIQADDLMVEAEDGEQFAPYEGETVTLRRDLPWRASRLSGDRPWVEYCEDAILILKRQIVSWTLTDPDSEDEDGKREPYPAPGADGFESFLWDMNADLRWWLIGKILKRNSLPNA